ncbi:MAG: hypothetical protein ACK4FZ_11685 [Vogesella sp.]|uniref:hypothetical protein n=1 Tax=Vogesella sp. TaxID=1904252 RepID=UPI00391B926B
MKTCHLLTLLLALASTAAWADPPAARRLAANPAIEPPSEAAFLRDYQRRQHVVNGHAQYHAFLQRWRAAKADGWLLDAASYQASFVESAR